MHTFEAMMIGVTDVTHDRDRMSGTHISSSNALVYQLYAKWKGSFHFIPKDTLSTPYSFTQEDYEMR